jgi:hypothetical protein
MPRHKDLVSLPVRAKDLRPGSGAAAPLTRPQLRQFRTQILPMSGEILQQRRGYLLSPCRIGQR